MNVSLLVDIVAMLAGVLSLIVTVAIFFLGRRLSFKQQRERVRELESKAWEVLGPMRTDGLNNKIIVMNVARYKRGYDGSNKMTRHGYAYTGAELIEIVHGGIEVVIKGISSYYDSRGRRTLVENNDRAPTVIECGHIPWEWIEDITPNGDEFDGSPIFFVHFKAYGRRPYNFITYKEGRPVPFGPNNRDYYRPLSQLGTRRPRFLHDRISFLKCLWQDRKLNREPARRKLR